MLLNDSNNSNNQTAPAPENNSPTQTTKGVPEPVLRSITESENLADKSYIK